MQTFTTPGLASVDDPIKSRHDIKTTRQSIKQILSNGTPNWVRFPNDYKAFARESYLAEKEQSDRQVKSFRMDDQDLLTDAAPRKVNILMARDFVKKLRDNGVKCFTVDNGMRQTVALWACAPGSEQMKYIAYLQTPCMYEWSVLRLDRHNLPNGESFRGWRTVIIQLVEKGILTEEKAHHIFGKPTDAIVSRRYRQSLYNYRNRKRLDSNNLT